MPKYDDRHFTPPAPVASVRLGRSDGSQSVADAMMQIDSGADMTLLPNAIVSSLGIVRAGERCQLVAFDGTVSEADVVQAVLTFKGRRFHGRYALIESEIGVLGRDVLNHSTDFGGAGESLGMICKATLRIVIQKPAARAKERMAMARH
jgi:hypothetical protein